MAFLINTNYVPPSVGSVSQPANSTVLDKAGLTFEPTFNTGQITNVWNLLSNDWTHLGPSNTERGLACKRNTTNLLMVSRAGPDPRS